MGKRANSSIPSQQNCSAGPRGRNSPPSEGCWPERLFESTYCSALSIAAKNSCFSAQSGGGRMTAPHSLSCSCRFVSVQGQSDANTNYTRSGFRRYLGTGSSLVK